MAIQGANSFIFDLPAFSATLRSTHIDALAMWRHLDRKESDGRPRAQPLVPHQHPVMAVHLKALASTARAVRSGIKETRFIGMA